MPVCAGACALRCKRTTAVVEGFDAPIKIRALKRFVNENYGVESIKPDTQDELLRGAKDEGNKQRWQSADAARQSRQSIAILTCAAK